jgi:Phytanoyl-CoA dioxygenase (PhyH)
VTARHCESNFKPWLDRSVQSFAADDSRTVHWFIEHGWVLIDTLDADGVAALRGWVDEISAWPDGHGDCLHYRELTDAGPKLCRTENFVPSHAAMRALLTSGPMLAMASSLLGQPAVLYKQKINYKLAGGAGYAPHQDAPAYPFIDAHVSCMVAIDDADVANGCLEVVGGRHHELLPIDDVGCIRADVVETMDWEPAPIRAGQTLWFHSRTPHRSAANNSSSDRRALYPTYNALAEGDLREKYYREKLDRMEHARVGDGVQVSLIGDFQGRPVT